MPPRKSKSSSLSQMTVFFLVAVVAVLGLTVVLFTQQADNSQDNRSQAAQIQTETVRSWAPSGDANGALSPVGSPISIYPTSGNWNKTPSFVIKNIYTSSVTFRYLLDCWNEQFCTDETGTTTLSVGESVTLGLGEVCSKWQLDLNLSGQPGWDWGAIVEQMKECPSTTPTPTPIASCKVGYLYSRKSVETAYPKGGAVSAEYVTANLPKNTTLVKMSLYGDKTITQETLNGLDVIIVSEGNTAAAERNTAIPAHEYMTSKEQDLLALAFKNGTDFLLVGDNPSTRLGIDEAAIIIRPLMNVLQKNIFFENKVPRVAQLQTTTKSGVWGENIPWMSGLNIDTTGALNTPGWVKRQSNIDAREMMKATCMYEIMNGSSKTDLGCLVGLLPATQERKSMLYFDVNFGNPTKTPGFLKTLITNACATK